MRRAFAGLTIAAGLGILLATGGSGFTTAWAQDGAKSAASGLPPLVREEGSPPPTVELKDLPLHSGGAQLRASGPARQLGATTGSAPPATMAGDAGLAATGRSLEEKARRQ